MAKIKVTELLADFEYMRDQHWAYEAGAEEEGKVDCSGAFVYAYRQHGKSIAHGSNRIARVYVANILPIKYAKPGMAAFKALEPWEEGYELPDDYKPGNAYYNGDTNDYYHIGLVGAGGDTVLNAKGTAYGFVESLISEGWDYAAYLLDVDYGEEPQPEPEPTADEYRVVGGRLNLRSKPEKKAPAIRSLADGEIVRRIADAGEWMKVKAGRETGYAMKQYLEPVGGAGGDIIGGGGECVPVNKEKLYAAKMAIDAAKMTIDAVFEDASVAAGVLSDE